MGLDFIRRAAPTFTKSWNHGARDLAQPTLFTRYPECRTRTIVAVMEDGKCPPEGSQIAVLSRGAELVLLHQVMQVGVIESPPPDLLRAIEGAGGCALGSIARLNPLSGTADVEVE